MSINFTTDSNTPEGEPRTPFSGDEDNPHHKPLLEGRRLASIRSLVLIALFGAPMSLLFGGLLLSVIAAICAVMALVKFHKSVPSPSQPQASRSLRVMINVALGLCAFSLVLNIYAFVTVFQYVYSALESGNLESLGLNPSALGTLGGENSSIWG